MQQLQADEAEFCDRVLRPPTEFDIHDSPYSPNQPAHAQHADDSHTLHTPKRNRPIFPKLNSLEKRQRLLVTSVTITFLGAGWTAETLVQSNLNTGSNSY